VPREKAELRLAEWEGLMGSPFYMAGGRHLWGLATCCRGTSTREASQKRVKEMLLRLRGGRLTSVDGGGEKGGFEENGLRTPLPGG